MGTKTQNTMYHSPMANLAYAIIRSGEKCHDVRFLESDWCELLREICRLDDKMYGDRKLGNRGGGMRVTSAHIAVEAE